MQHLIVVLVAWMATLGASLTWGSEDIPSTGRIKVNLQSVKGYSGADRKKLELAADLVERVLGSDEFKYAVLAHTYQGRREFVDNNGLSNADIYRVLMNGREILNPYDNQTMDLHLVLYQPPFWKRWSVKGYTYEHTLNIWVNRNWFRYFHVSQVAGNMMHEWCHKLGFGHDFKATARRPFSVPYAVGEILVAEGRKIFQ
jgi:hypothetical protein